MFLIQIKPISCYKKTISVSQILKPTTLPLKIQNKKIPIIKYNLNFLLSNFKYRTINNTQNKIIGKIPNLVVYTQEVLPYIKTGSL